MTTGSHPMRSPLVVKFIGVKALGILVAMGIVWISIDLFAVDHFAALLERYRIPDKQQVIGMFLQSAHRYLALGGIVAFAIALGLGFVFVKVILSPLHQMLAITLKIARGDFTSRVQIFSNDEVGQLGRTFNLMTDNLARTEQLRKKMVVDVAHELRAPLTNIRGYLEAISDGVVPQDSKIIELLHEETLRLGNLSEDLMRLSVADSARLTLEREMIDLREFLPHSMKLFQAQFAEKDIAAETLIASGAEWVLVDAEKLAQIMQNLLDNACKFTATGGRVTVTVERTAGDVKIMVANTGEPIADDDLSLIFERFYRVEKSRSAERSGAGIGLAIVKDLVESHGGQVGAESSNGENRIWFALPLTAN
jgi:two-component system sensor histidine kinase BaeS